MHADQRRDYVEYVRSRIPRLHHVAYLVLADRDQADDAVQNALTVLYRRWTRLVEVEDLDAYVHTMVVRACLAERRRPWSRVLLRRDTPDGPVAGGERRIDEQLLIQQALNRLPEHQRIVVVLRFLCDMPVAEVARMIGRSEGTVKSRTSYALTALRRAIPSTTWSAS